MSLALLGSALALAAPFGEVPSLPVKTGVGCIAATGAPGEFVRSRGDAVQLVRVGPNGLAPGPVVKTPGSSYCAAAVAASANGHGAIAFHDDRHRSFGVGAYLRAPGAGWEPADTGMDLGENDDVAVAAAVSERGDAIVAAAHETFDKLQITVARRAPGGGFSAQERLQTVRGDDIVSPQIATGISSAGEAIVAWRQLPARRIGPNELWVAAASPGAPFGKPVRVGTLGPGAPFDLAVAPDGRALLAFPSGGRLLVAERTPGAAWGPAIGVAETVAALPAVALRADGGAVVTWSEPFNGSVKARLREGPGAFAPAAELAPPARAFAGLRPYLKFTESIFRGFGDDYDFASLGGADRVADGSPDALFAGDGRAFVTWVGEEYRDGVRWGATHVALVGATPERVVLGAELRDVFSAILVPLESGAPAVVWGHNDVRGRNGRIHAALEGAPDAADPPPPAVTFGTPRPRVLSDLDFLTLPVRCSAACDVRVHVAGSIDAVHSISLPMAGSKDLSLGSVLTPIAPLKAAPVQLQVRYGAPGARRAVATTVSPTVRRRPDPPAPRIRIVSARRRGDWVNVRWRVVGQTEPRFVSVFGVNGKDVPVSSALSRRLFDPAHEIWRVKVMSIGRYVSSLRTVSARVRG